MVGDHGRPDVGLEVLETAPSAAAAAVGALKPGDDGFDAGAEVAQASVDEGLLTMSAIAMPHFL